MGALRMLGWVDLWIAVVLAHVLPLLWWLGKRAEHKRTHCPSCRRPYMRPIGHAADAWCWVRIEEAHGSHYWRPPPPKEEAKP